MPDDLPQLEGRPVIEIPFRLASPEVPLILVPARANGVAFEAVLDTGNGAPSTFLLAHGSRSASG